MRAVNPATGAVIREYEEHSPAAVRGLLRASAAAFAAWRRVAVPERSRLLREAGRVLRAGKARYAALATEEMGKPIAAAEAEVEKCALVCDHYAEHAARYLAPEEVRTDASRSYVRYDPLGPVLAVMPWNFPFWQVFRFAAPGLAAGNTGLLKHASNVPGCALAIEEVFRLAGFPDGAFVALLVPAAAVPDLIRDPVVAAVTITGSEPAGMSVAAEAGRALKKCVLELGGSDPFVVLADADLPAAVRTAVAARIVNNGQSCIAAKRFIVEDAIHDDFEAAFVAAMAALRVGDPRDRAVDVGPLARPDLVADLDGQVRRSVAAGAVLRLGGRPVAGPGCFYEPTVLSGVEPGMAAFDEETFGPLAALVRARDADHAVELANRTTFGLGACVFTRDLARAGRLAAEIEAGAVFVNGMVKSDPRLPFGGVKRSGYGRELSVHGIREFVNAKTVWIA